MKSFSETRKTLEESSILYAQSLEKAVKPPAASDEEEAQTDTTSAKVKAAILDKTCSLKLNDGTHLSLTNKDVEALAVAREDLNRENRELFDSMLCENLDSFACALEFARNYHG